MMTIRTQNEEEKDIKALERLQVGHRQSLGFDNPTMTPAVMSVEEFVCVFHIANLYLAEMDEIAQSIIEQQLNRISCKDLFHGNIHRFHALCMTSILEKKLNTYFSTFSPENPTKEELFSDNKKILHTLKKSQIYFDKIPCRWGTGLVHFQTAQLYEKGLIRK